MQVRYFSEKRREKVELDEIFETLHNLASSLMNKTLLQLKHRMIFKNLQSISVGIWCCNKKH